MCEKEIGTPEFQKVKDNIYLKIFEPSKCEKLDFYAAFFDRRPSIVLVAVIKDKTKDGGYEIIHRSKMEKIWKVDRETLKKIAFENTTNWPGVFDEEDDANNWRL